jgi:hypothetical protein
VLGAIALAVALFFVVRAGGDDEGNGPATEAEPTATVEDTTTAAAETEQEDTTTAPPAPPPPPPGPREIPFNIPAGGPQGIRRVQIQQNERVVLLIRSAVADHAHLHGYDLLADVGPGGTARIAFRASVPGRFEIELEDRGQPFAELTVTP